jgi:hypothetical protein
MQDPDKSLNNCILSAGLPTTTNLISHLEAQIHAARWKELKQASKAPKEGKGSIAPYAKAILTYDQDNADKLVFCF